MSLRNFILDVSKIELICEIIMIIFHFIFQPSNLVLKIHFHIVIFVTHSKIFSFAFLFLSCIFFKLFGKLFFAYTVEPA